MIIKTLNTFILLSLITLVACSQDRETIPEKANLPDKKVKQTATSEPHNYGGWYCPDNLNGFPAVNFGNWENVPVVSGRLPTKEETRNGSSLIFVDTEKYPYAKSLDIKLPRLATYKNVNTKREELIIVIQAIQIGNDYIVGFRYLNGGNGSARMDEVNFISDAEATLSSSAKFVTLSVNIEAKPEAIWKLLTDAKHAETLQPTFDPAGTLNNDWREYTNVNFNYPGSGEPTSQYANLIYGNYYVQNDYDAKHYTEKFMLLENEETGETELKVVCGPYNENYDEQKQALTTWTQKIKASAEKD